MSVCVARAYPANGHNGDKFANSIAVGRMAAIGTSFQFPLAPAEVAELVQVPLR